MLPQGYGALTARLAQGLDIRLGERVERVGYGPAGVEVATTGGLHTAAHAIVTLPLGVLQAGSVAFDPQLPSDVQVRLAAGGRPGARRAFCVQGAVGAPCQLTALFVPARAQAAIGRLGMGDLEKVVLWFEEPFWDTDVQVGGHPAAPLPGAAQPLVLCRCSLRRRFRSEQCTAGCAPELLPFLHLRHPLPTPAGPRLHLARAWRLGRVAQYGQADRRAW